MAQKIIVEIDGVRHQLKRSETYNETCLKCSLKMRCNVGKHDLPCMALTKGKADYYFEKL
jgi:hypothetical protein